MQMLGTVFSFGRRTGLALAVIWTISVPAQAQLGDACEVADNGSGTVTLPPEGCGYLSPQEVHMIIDGLPPGTTIELSPIHRGFFCRAPQGRGACLIEPGGGLGGEREVFDSRLVFELRGTGDLNGFRRVMTLEAAVETHTAPRNPGDPVQAFDTEMFLLQGALPPGDPDFAQLQVVAGAGINPALQSFGHTSLRDLGDGNFNVDSFFDITYEITFQGAPGGALDGLAGTTQHTTRMEARSVRPKNRCIVDDDGTGTVTLPPPGCGYLSPRQVHMIISGLPPGTTIELEPLHARFVCPGGVCGQPGGNLGGQRETFDSLLIFQLSGTGALADFRRTLRVPAAVVTDTAPRTPGDPIQSFVTDMVNLQGSLTGDPDFADLTIVAGSTNGLPSPGHTLLEDLGDGTFNVDSFFDITYQIDFQGAPGGALEGLSGSTQATVRMEARTDRDDAVERDNGNGTITLPPPGSQYVSPHELHMMIDGLPPGTTLEIDPSHHHFFCETRPCAEAGGSLGGNVEKFDSTLDLVLTGTGNLAGFRRNLVLPVGVETHTAPVTPGVAGPPQGFDTDMFRLQGVLLGDPDFAQLAIVGGTDNGLPSPGHTTLTDLGDGTFNVDSFFDITYRIDFVGAPGGALDGMSGSTEDTVRVTAVDDPAAVARDITIIQVAEPLDATDFGFTGQLGTFSLDDDADPTLSDRFRFDNLGPGNHTVSQTLPAGWLLRGIECEDPDGGSQIDVATGTATIDLDLGESITCTFSNLLESTLIFEDGFESGDVTVWSSSTP